MIKKEFEKGLMREMMKYYLFCSEIGRNVKDCKSHSLYQDFLKDAKVHHGDCTKEIYTCQRCMLNGIEIEAQNIVDSMFFGEKGHCGKNCLTECDYKEKDESNNSRE
jgi:hypothetical protein